MASRPSEPRWLSRLVVDAIHADQLREHGGMAGLREEAALESALARPKQKWACADTPGLPVLAAAYAFGLVRNHPYNDGNKRIGLLALVTLLAINGHDLDATDEEVVTTMLAFADGSLTEARLAQWVHNHLRPAS